MNKKKLLFIFSSLSIILLFVILLIYYYNTTYNNNNSKYKKDINTSQIQGGTSYNHADTDGDYEKMLKEAEEQEKLAKLQKVKIDLYSLFLLPSPFSSLILSYLHFSLSSSLSFQFSIF